MTINELLDRAKQRANIESDYALAKVLGIERQIISGWRKEKRHPSNEEAIKLATLANLEELQVIGEIEYRTANSEKKKEFWKQFLEHRGYAATLGLMALGTSIILTPEPAAASILQLQNYGEISTDFLRPQESTNIHYAKYQTWSNRLLRLFSSN